MRHYQKGISFDGTIQTQPKEKRSIEEVSGEVEKAMIRHNDKAKKVLDNISIILSIIATIQMWKISRLLSLAINQYAVALPKEP